MDDVYQDRQDPALTVGFQLETGEKLLVWTTTPWTLPSNLAVAVGPDIDYAVLERAGDKVIVGAARASVRTPRNSPTTSRSVRSRAANSSAARTRRCSTSWPTPPHAFRVLGGDFVSTEDGTGAVHMAPAFGEDDQNLCPRGRHNRPW